MFKVDSIRILFERVYALVAGNAGRGGARGGGGTPSLLKLLTILHRSQVYPMAPLALPPASSTAPCWILELVSENLSQLG